MLTVLGYQEEDNSLVMKEFNLNDLKKIADILWRYKNFYWLNVSIVIKCLNIIWKIISWFCLIILIFEQNFSIMIVKVE